MPIYEYKCNECEVEFEWLTLSANDDNDVTCSKCQSHNVTKLMSAGSIRSDAGPSLPSLPTAGCGSGGGFS